MSVFREFSPRKKRGGTKDQDSGSLLPHCSTLLSPGEPSPRRQNFPRDIVFKSPRWKHAKMEENIFILLLSTLIQLTTHTHT